MRLSAKVILSMILGMIPFAAFAVTMDGTIQLGADITLKAEKIGDFNGAPPFTEWVLKQDFDYKGSWGGEIHVRKGTCIRADWTRRRGEPGDFDTYTFEARDATNQSFPCHHNEGYPTTVSFNGTSLNGVFSFYYGLSPYRGLLKSPDHMNLPALNDTLEGFKVFWFWRFPNRSGVLENEIALYRSPDPRDHQCQRLTLTPIQGQVFCITAIALKYRTDGTPYLSRIVQNDTVTLMDPEGKPVRITPGQFIIFDENQRVIGHW